MRLASGPPGMDNAGVMTLYELILNLVAALFWFAFWNPDNRDTFFNPYVLRLRAWSDALIDGIRPLAGRLLSRRFIAGLLLITLLAAKGFLHYSGLRGTLTFGIDSDMPYVEQHRDITPPAPHFADADLEFAALGILLCKVMLFSGASFGVIIFKIWAVALIYVGTRQPHGLSRAEGTLYSLARPLTSFRPEFRPFFLLFLGAVIVGSQFIFRRGLFPFELAGISTFLITALLSTVSACINVLYDLVYIIALLVLASWIALFAMSASFGLVCREWLDLFLGPLKNRPVKIGVMDISPIVVAAFFLTLATILRHLVMSSYALLR